VRQIVRVQNPQLWERFQLAKKSLREKLGRESDILELWHGHREIGHESITAGEEGFDQRFAYKDGAYGAGNYFAVHSSYSA